MNKHRELFELIEHSTSFDEVRGSGLLPEPDSDDGYYFVSYSHRDYKAVVKDILALCEEGAILWYDRGLESGKSWIREVRQKMSSYYCKGAIVYLSASYLASYSCMMELDHLISVSGKSVLFILLDSSVSAKAEEIRDSALYHGLSCADNPVLKSGRLFESYELLVRTDSPERKLAACSRFKEPQLIQYTYLYGVQDIAHRVTDFIMGRCASVSGIADKNVKRVVIPRFVDHDGQRYRVVRIETSAFSQCELLEEVVVSDGWMNIGHHAFVRCPSLRRVVLGTPGSLFFTRMGIVNDVFDRCPSATLVAKGAIRYNSAFKGRDDIRVARHGREETWYGECFAGCLRLERAELGKYDYFGERMFGGCTALEEVEIPYSNVTQKLHRCFESCERLRSIRLPKKIREIGARSFFGCASLKEIEIPPRVRFIARDAFLGCDAIETVILNSGRLSNFKNLPYQRGVPLDELFPGAKSFYLRHLPRGARAFRGDFVEKISDKKGYKLFVRRNDGE